MASENERRRKIVALLDKAYPDAKMALRFASPMECLVATMLSAQCTDGMVNRVTQKLFRTYRSPGDYASANLKTLEKLVYSTGFYRNKAKNIREAARIIVASHDGQVPRTMEALTALPGVARKTANIVLGNAFGMVEGIAVDTHVGRLSRRLGFTANSDPEKVERDLMRILPKERWFRFSYVLIEHGRKVCQAKRPRCDGCLVERLCPKKGVASG